MILLSSYSLFPLYMFYYILKLFTFYAFLTCFFSILCLDSRVHVQTSAAISQSHYSTAQVFLVRLCLDPNIL